MLQTRIIHRIILALGLCTLLGAAQCVVVAPPPPPGGGRPPPANRVLADFTRYAECRMRTGDNGGRGFYDVGLNRCYSCPRGYRRSVFDVRSRRACVRRATRYAIAEPLGRPGCRARGEFRVVDTCYRCPRGYRRIGDTRRCIARR